MKKTKIRNKKSPLNKLPRSKLRGILAKQGTQQAAGNAPSPRSFAYAKRAGIQKDVITITELSYFFRMRRRILERLVMLDLIEPLSAEPEFCFPIDLIPRLEKMIRLHYQLGVSWNSMALVMELLVHIEKMEKKG